MDQRESSNSKTMRMPSSAGMLASEMSVPRCQSVWTVSILQIKNFLEMIASKRRLHYNSLQNAKSTLDSFLAYMSFSAFSCSISLMS
eukprot:gene8669-17893_t